MKKDVLTRTSFFYATIFIALNLFQDYQRRSNRKNLTGTIKKLKRISI